MQSALKPFWSARWTSLVLFAGISLMIFVRMQLVDRNIGTYIACPGCFDVAVISADLVLFSICSGLLLLAGLPRPAILARFIQLLLGGVIVVYLADLVVFRLFNSRLFLTDAALFFNEREAVWNQFSTGMGGPLATWAILIAILLLFVFLWLMPPVRSARLRLVLTAVLAVSLLAQVTLSGSPYVNGWAVDNVLAANLATSERARYKAETAQQILSKPRRELRVETPGPESAAAGRNVILIMLESWSSWHSLQFGGFEDWTPNLDAAARRGLRYERFHSIGFSTDKGLVGILGGQPIWAPFLHWFQTPPFHSMWGLDQTMPGVFNRQGYHTAFLTTGPLSIYRKGEWLTDLGFDYVEGNEHPAYAALPRYAFGSASDDALYARAEEWRRDADEPFLLVLETVTTHQPYTDPETGERSLERVMRFADRAFSDYLQSLDGSGFFDSGILLVVSDHRSMTPIPAEELARFGADAHSQVPAFVVGREFPANSTDQQVYSQSDLVPSFNYWLSGAVDLLPHQKLMLGPVPERSESSAGPRCAFHSRGDRRSLVEVICDSGRGQVRLDGDQSGFTHHDNLDGASRQAILEDIARWRLQGAARQEQREAMLAEASQ